MKRWETMAEEEKNQRKIGKVGMIIAWIIFVEFSLLSLTWVVKTIVELIERF